ncbi:effector-associated constant component EACC1 [Actinacidiphila yeochonensis]|uniref:effector-associated constant component EACC1 n=1 Tax=Actinacidiphila yeochonensis TaxID=89050 RepID=UPI00068A2283|nr:hypothetical protein [Actinacidiphila yeochonensis]
MTGETGDLRIEVGGGADDLRSLYHWLRDEESLRGRVRGESPLPGEAEMGAGLLDVLVVAAGSGGVGAVLAGALSTWIAQRRSDVEITITAQDGSTVEVKGARVDAHVLMRDVERLLERGEREE